MSIRFSPPIRCDALGCGKRHHHQDDWNDYWSALSESEKQSVRDVRDKAQWEGETLSKIAKEYGAIQEDSP